MTDGHPAADYFALRFPARMTRISNGRRDPSDRNRSLTIPKLENKTMYHVDFRDSRAKANFPPHTRIRHKNDFANVACNMS
jgi:hypothetical protein